MSSPSYTIRRMTPALVGSSVAFGVLLLVASALYAQGPPLTPRQLNENCVVSVLNRNVRANPDGTWVLPNVPANFGPVRARATCVIDGKTMSGESDPFEVPANGAVNIPKIRLGQTTPIPVALTITAQATTLTTIGQMVLLSVTARYPDGTTREVTAGAGTTYGVTNAAIATVSATGVVEAQSSGTVIVQATLEGASGMLAMSVRLQGTDSDGDGIPDAEEVRLGLNPNNPIDALEDFDRDNLTNKQEYELGTDLRKADTDGDGLKDGDEVARGTGPFIPDSDGDGIRDGLEVTCASDPLDPTKYNLSCALSSLSVTPPVFTLTFNTVAGDASVQLKVTGALKDGTSIDLTARARDINYESSDLAVCSFSGTLGRVFAGISGTCSVTVTVAGFKTLVPGTVTTFNPTPLSSVVLDGPGNGVDVAGNYVYVAAGNAGLHVVDVSDRAAPEVVATLSLIGTANDVKIEGTRAAVAAGAAGVHIIDVSNPLVPRLIGSVDTPGTATDVRIRGDFVYAADGGAGLHVIDVSDSSAPRIAGTVATTGPANGVDIADTFAVVAERDTGVQIVNVADPAHPFVVSTLDTPGDALDVVVRGRHAFVADYTGSIRAVDFTNPNAPLLGGTLPGAVGGYLLDIALIDTLTFGADVLFVNSVPITDVSDVNNLRSRPRIDFPGDATGLGIAVDGSYVYLGTDTNRLYVGQYRIQQDLNGIPPTVRIVSPSNGVTFVEGEAISVTVDASDDLAVRGVTLLVDGKPVGTDTTAPYQFTVTAPTGGNGTLTLGAEAGDLGNNTGVAESAVVNVIPDPLTAVEGRVVKADRTPVQGATVTCRGANTTTFGNGSFSLGGLPTVQPTITCAVRFVEVDGIIFGGSSAPVVAARGGVTQVGDIVIAPVAIVDSIAPKVVDATNPPTTLAIAGRNLTGSTFRFVPELVPPAITVGTPVINGAGTNATLPVTIDMSARGRFTLVGTNAFGGGDATPTEANTLLIFNAADDVDSDSDGFPDGLELLLGSDPADRSSTPTLSTHGNLTSRTVSVVNRTFPFAVEKSFTQWFSIVNTTFPFTVPKSSTQSFSLLNTTFPFDVPRNSTQLFSLLNTTFPLTVEKNSTQWFSVRNSFLPPPTQTLVSPAVSIRNLRVGEPGVLESARAANQPRAAGAGAGGELLAISLDGVSATRRLIEGETLVIGGNVSGGNGTGTVGFSVNGAILATDGVAPYTMTFTVPSGVSELTFGAAVQTLDGQTASAASLTVSVDPDVRTSVTGRVVDGQGTPVVNTVVELFSDGLRADLFDARTALVALPDLAGATPTLSTRVTALNTRGPAGLFGPDPFGTGLAPDYAARFTGWLSVPIAGSYTFFLGADEGARLRVRGVTVVDMPNPAPGGFQESSGAIDLPVGLVQVEITFYESTGNAELQLSFTPPGDLRQVVPPSMLVPVAAPFVAVTDGDGRFTLRDVPMALDNVRVRVPPSSDGAAEVTVPVVGPLSAAGVDVGEVVLPRRP